MPRSQIVVDVQHQLQPTIMRLEINCAYRLHLSVALHRMKRGLLQLVSKWLDAGPRILLAHSWQSLAIHAMPTPTMAATLSAQKASSSSMPWLISRWALCADWRCKGRHRFALDPLFAGVLFVWGPYNTMQQQFHDSLHYNTSITTSWSQQCNDANKLQYIDCKLCVPGLVPPTQQNCRPSSQWHNVWCSEE